MPYQVPHNIDPNKIFLVNFSELEKRWDPMYYTSLFVDNFKKISSSQYQQEKLSDLTSLISDGTHFTPTYTDCGIKFLSVKDVRKSDINFSDTKFISEEEAALLDTRCIPTKGDILLTKIGTIGYAAVIKSNERFQIFVSLALIRPKDNTLSKYLEIYLNSCYSYIQFKRCLKGAGVPDLHLEEIRNLIVVVPPSEKRKDIVSFYERAFIQRRQKLNESKQKLASIDAYLLSELGIRLPEKDNSLEKRIFTVNFSEVCGGRFDPKRYSTESELIKDAVSKGKYESKPLKAFITQSVAGDWGYDADEEVPNSIKCLVIRSTEFDNEYNLKLDNSRAKYRNILKTKLDNINLQVGDLLVEKSGGSEDQPVGRVAIVTDAIMKQGNICYSNFIHKISVTDILPEYLYCYLKTAHNIKLTDAMQSQTNGLRNLILSEYFNQQIPFPSSIDKQREIADNIAAIRAEAKRLEQEGEEILQSARQQVEKMILGE